MLTAFKTLVKNNTKDLSSKKTVIPVFILALVSFFVYYPSIFYDFAYDDNVHIVRNPLIRKVEMWPLIFTSPIYPGNLYRPVLIFSYAVTYYLLGEAPWIYHLENLFLNSWIVIFLFLLLRYFFDDLISFIIALIFAVHPIHVEVVANISGRSELLCHFFGITALVLSQRFITASTSLSEGCRKRKTICYFFIIVCILGCLFAKESGIVFILLLLLLQRYRRDQIDKRAGMLVVLSFIICFVFLLVCRWHILGSRLFGGGAIDPLDNVLAILPRDERVRSAFYYLYRYFEQILIPSVISADYSYPQFTPLLSRLELHQSISLITLSLILLIGVIGFTQKHWSGFFIGWFFLSFAVTSNILLPIGTIYAERLSYLPSFGVIGVLVFLLYSLMQLISQRVFYISISAIFLIFGFHSFVAQQNWYDDITLGYSQTLNAPKSARTWNNFALIQLNAQKPAEALKSVDKALTLYKYSHFSYSLRGDAYLRLNDVEKAKEAYLESVRLDDLFSPPLVHLGKLLYDTGEYQDAIKYLSKVTNDMGTQEKLHIIAQRLLYNSYLKIGRIEDAASVRNELLQQYGIELS